MAESDFARIGPGTPIVRATINAPAANPADTFRTIRDDPTTYPPLRAPGADVAGFAPPSPPIKDEPTLRAELAEMLDVEHIASTRQADAEHAHARALRHLERCRCDLQRYDSLDADLTLATADALRQDGDLEIAPELRNRLAERDMAVANLGAAERASAVLKQELATATGAATTATQRVADLLASILAFAAAAIAERHELLTAQAAQLRETLHAFNQFGANRRVAIPPAVRTLLGNDTSTLARRRDQSQWLAAAGNLRADPTATVEVT